MSRQTFASIHWLRIAAEAVAIVASILLAFAIDAWWDARQKRNEADQLVRGLQIEFSAHRRTVIGQINRIRSTLVSGYRFDAWSAGDGAPIPADSLPNFLAPLLFPASLDLGTGVLLEASNTGKINSITNTELKVELARWPAALGEAKDHEASVEKVVDEHLRPLLNRLILLPPTRRGFANAPLEQLWRDPRQIHRQFVTNALTSMQFRNEISTLLDGMVASLGDKRPFLDYIDRVLDLLDADLRSRGLQSAAPPARTPVPDAPQILASAFAEARGAWATRR